MRRRKRRRCVKEGRNTSPVKKSSKRRECVAGERSKLEASPVSRRKRRRRKRCKGEEIEARMRCRSVADERVADEKLMRR
nr:hypothetical protein CFP56_51904 [Quercus suber]